MGMAFYVITILFDIILLMLAVGETQQKFKIKQLQLCGSGGI